MAMRRCVTGSLTRWALAATACVVLVAGCASEPKQTGKSPAAAGAAKPAAQQPAPAGPQTTAAPPTAGPAAKAAPANTQPPSEAEQAALSQLKAIQAREQAREQSGEAPRPAPAPAAAPPATPPPATQPAGRNNAGLVVRGKQWQEVDRSTLAETPEPEIPHKKAATTQPAEQPAQPATPAQPTSKTPPAPAPQPTTQATSDCHTPASTDPLEPPPAGSPQPRYVCKAPSVTVDNVWRGQTANFAFTVANEGQATLRLRLKGG